MAGIIDIVWTLAIIVGVIFFFRFLLGRMKSQGANARRAMNERMETLFKTGFPELQPHFHPKNVYEFAEARAERKAARGAYRWPNPPGFVLAAEADMQPDGPKEKVRLLDKAGAVLAEFVVEEHAEGAALRVGKGKLTVGLKGPEPRVRYWHPEREFKWTPTSWNMKSGLSEQPLHSRGGTSSDYDHDTSPDWSSRTSSMAVGAAAGAGIAAAAAAGQGDSAPDFSGVESGASSTSTSY